MHYREVRFHESNSFKSTASSILVVTVVNFTISNFTISKFFRSFPRKGTWAAFYNFLLRGFCVKSFSVVVSVVAGELLSGILQFVFLKVKEGSSVDFSCLAVSVILPLYLLRLHHEN